MAGALCNRMDYAAVIFIVDWAQRLTFGPVLNVCHWVFTLRRKENAFRRKLAAIGDSAEKKCVAIKLRCRTIVVTAGEQQKTLFVRYSNIQRYLITMRIF